MKILNIQNEDELKILREVSRAILKTDFDSGLVKKISGELIETLKAEEKAIGLAAPQIGYNLRIFVISKRLYLNLFGGDLIFINPKIIEKSSEKEISEEGCLSILNRRGNVLRYKEIKVEFLNQKGEKQKLKLKNLAAFVFQHELDHLDGILFIDKEIN